MPILTLEGIVENGQIRLRDRVTLRNPHSEATVSDVLLLLDTGADITLLPHTAVELLGVSLLAGQQYELMGFDGSKSHSHGKIGRRSPSWSAPCSKITR